MSRHNLRTALSLVPVFVMVFAPCVSAERAIVPLRIHNGFPIFVAKIDGKSVSLVFDLGGDFHLTLSESALAGLDAMSLNETYEFSDAKGNILQSPMFKVRRIEIGEVAFTDVVGHLDTSHPTYKAQTDGREGMIGAPFLQKYKVVLDYMHREMTLIPGESAVSGRDECTGTEVPFLPGVAGFRSDESNHRCRRAYDGLGYRSAVVYDPKGTCTSERSQDREFNLEQCQVRTGGRKFRAPSTSSF